MYGLQLYMYCVCVYLQLEMLSYLMFKKGKNSFRYSSVQFSSVVSDSLWPHERQASLSIIISQSLPKPTSIESVMPPNHRILCHPLLLLPSIFPSITVFSNESALRIRWPKYWSFNISPSHEHSGRISLQSKGLSRVFSNTTVQKHQFFSAQPLHSPTLTSIHNHWKNHSLD